MSDKALQNALYDYNYVFLKLRQRLKNLIKSEDEKKWSILDIGCGYHYPNVALFNNSVREICGIDIEPVFFREGRIKTLLSRNSSHGLLRALKWATIRYNYYTSYYKNLSKFLHCDIDHQRLKLFHYLGNHLPFNDQKFDIAISNAVLEHVADIEQFVEEVARVLKPAGKIDMIWHNFYCPTGGHRHPKEVKSDPWGHIFSEKNGDLNRKRPEEFAAAFEKYFDIIQIIGVDHKNNLYGTDDFEFEGKEFLTEEWRSLLKDFPEQLLTTRAFLIQAIKL